MSTHPEAESGIPANGADRDGLLTNPASPRPHRGRRLVICGIILACLGIAGVVVYLVRHNIVRGHPNPISLRVCYELETAVNGFLAEYSRLPMESSADLTVRTDSAEGIRLLTILAGEENSPKPQNTRQIRFLSTREGKPGKCGIRYASEGGPITGLYDSWGGAFHIVLDGDGDETVTPVLSSGRKETPLKGRRVAVWSNGRDGVNGGGKPKDDVLTW